MSKKKFAGKPPEGGVVVAENDEWVLWDTLKGNGEWRSLKLVSKDRRERKANFWVGCNSERMAECKDKDCLMENYPELYDWVIGAIGL